MTKDQQVRLLMSLLNEGKPLVTAATFRADAVAITNDQHPQHELRIDRRSARVAIEVG